MPQPKKEREPRVNAELADSLTKAREIAARINEDRGIDPKSAHAWKAYIHQNPKRGTLFTAAQDQIHALACVARSEQWSIRRGRVDDLMNELSSYPEEDIDEFIRLLKEKRRL